MASDHPIDSRPAKAKSPFFRSHGFLVAAIVIIAVVLVGTAWPFIMWVLKGDD